MVLSRSSSSASQQGSPSSASLPSAPLLRSGRGERSSCWRSARLAARGDRATDGQERRTLRSARSSRLGLSPRSSSPAALASRHRKLYSTMSTPGVGISPSAVRPILLLAGPRAAQLTPPLLQTPASRRYQSTGYAPQSTASRHRRKRLLLLLGLLGLIVLLTVRPPPRHSPLLPTS